MDKKDINTFIPEKWDDQVFFFAEDILFSKKSGWHITINPDNCLVGMTSLEQDMPDIFEIRKEKPKKFESSEGFSLRGRILLSAGVIFFVDNKLVLFQRDEDAPVAPLKWTTPAGRLDKAPLYCALKEFYEELIAWDKLSNKPAFFQISNLSYESALRSVYTQTLKRKGFNSSEEDWLVIDCKSKISFFQETEKISVRFGCETIISPDIDFLPFYDQQNNTLEMMLPLNADRSVLGNIQPDFMDGEYERINKTYNIDKFLNLQDNILVNTAIFIKQQLKASASQ